MVHNANQIALFFASYTHEEAVAGVANHIQRFWEPRMREQLLSYVAAGGNDLNEIALEAAKRVSLPARP